MENQNNSNQDCGCGDGCCTPQKKSSLWKRLLFGVIILAAGTIVTVKLVAKQSAPSANCSKTEASSSCCPQTAPKKEPACCEQSKPAESSPCCSQPQSEKK